MVRSWSLLFVLLVVPLLLAARTSGGAPPSLRSDAAAVAVEGGAFYWKVGRFAVMVHSMWQGIKPVPRLERVVSASTRPAEGGGVDYLLVLRVAPPLGTCRVLVWGVPGEGSQDWKLKYFELVTGA